MRILIGIVLLVCLMSAYGVIVQQTNWLQDEVINRWDNFYPTFTLTTGLATLTILFISLKYKTLVLKSLKLSKTISIAVFASLPFIALATPAWFHSYADPDIYELGDAIWKLGYPLTFLIIDLPIYLRKKMEVLHFFDYLWMYPTVLFLFITQFSIYIHGIRIIINARDLSKANAVNFMRNYCDE